MLVIRGLASDRGEPTLQNRESIDIEYFALIKITDDF